MPTLLHGPGFNMGSGSGCPPSCALLGRFAIGHGLHCYGNIMRMQNVSDYMLVLALCLVTFRVSHRRREMYCGHPRLCVCLSAATCLHYCTDPDVTWGSGRGCFLVVPYWTDLQSVHGLRCYRNTRNAWHSPAVNRQAHRTLHTLHMHAPAIESTCLLRARRCLQRGHSISSILRGVVTRTQNVSEYMLVLALCLVSNCNRQLVWSVIVYCLFITVCAIAAVVAERKWNLNFTPDLDHLHHHLGHLHQRLGPPSPDT